MPRVALSKLSSDNILRASSIQRHPVLSACNTGNGTVLPGEVLASLRRAVEMAGARSSITSRWSVPSEASAELMRHLYGHIGAGMAPQRAA